MDKDTQPFASPVLPSGLWWNQFFCSACGSSLVLVVSVPKKKQSEERIYAAHCSNERCTRNNGGKPDVMLLVSV